MVKNPPANAGDMRIEFSPLVGKIPGGGHGNPLQYSCLENPMDRGAWRAIVHWVAKSQTQQKQHNTAQTAYWSVGQRSKKDRERPCPPEFSLMEEDKRRKTKNNYK